MTYQPVVPLSGYAGWVFLERTRESQQEAFNNSTQIANDLEYFTENIANVQTAEDLVADRRLLQVALGAFGLDEDINNKYFLQKVLEDGTLDDDALANRLTDTRYFEFSEAFGFGNFGIPNTVLSTFPDEIGDAYKTKQFEIAVGNADPNMRLALGLDDALAAIAEKDTTDDGRWYSIMGEAPVREVFEIALDLPAAIGALDLDQQLTNFRERAEARFGDSEVSQFTDPAKRDELVRLFLLRADPADSTGGVTGSSAALTLLQGAGSASNILLTATA